MADLQQTTLRFPADLYLKLRIRALEKGETMQSFITKLVERELKKAKP